MVAAVLMTVPMLILFLFLQRYFIAGITAGAVKYIMPFRTEQVSSANRIVACARGNH